MKHLYWTASLVVLILIWLILKLVTNEIRATRKSKVFVFVLMTSIMLISVDILWVLSEMNIIVFPIFVDSILGAAYYSLTGIAGYSCFLYSEHMQNERGDRLPKSLVWLGAIPAVALSVISFVSIGTGWLFAIGEDGIHVRGALYLVQPIVAMLYPLTSGLKSLVLTLISKNPYQRTRRLSITLYCWLIVALGAIQIVVPIVPFLNIATGIAVIHAFFFIQTFEREQFTNYSKIKSFSKLFLSAYHLDMNERTLERIDVAEQIKAADGYAEHLQAQIRLYDKAISYYIKNYVYPEDVTLYREMTTIDYICDHITPQTPYYFVTYRQVIGTVCKWYRLYVTSTSFDSDGTPINAILSTMDIDDEQRKISKAEYYKDMFITASMGVYDRILQVNISDDRVYDIAFVNGEMLRVDTGLGVKEHLDRFEETITPEYRENVIFTCRSFIAKSVPGDAVSYGYKTLETEASESGWFVTTLRAMESSSGDKQLMIFITDNTDKVKHRDMLEEKRRSDLMNNFIVNVLSSAVEFRSLETGDHVNRVIDLTRVMLKEYVVRNPGCNITEEDIHKISSAAALHDVGKIAIPDSILLKKGKLTPEEFAEMKNHTVYGCKILERFENKSDIFYQYCYDICRYHHERWDGRGYPEGLKGDAIPLWAQIVSIIDVYDALLAARSYKPAYSPKEALRMINDGECGTFSPKVLECFNATVGTFIGM